MHWASVNEDGGLKWATAFVRRGEGQPDHSHPEFQILVLEHGRLRVWAPSLLPHECVAPTRLFFLPGEVHGWEALEPSLVFSLWQKSPVAA